MASFNFSRLAVAMLALTMGLITACGEKKKDGVQVQTGRAPVPGAPGSVNQVSSGSVIQLSNGTVISGIVYADPVHQTSFQAAIEKFLEPVIDSEYVGQVSSIGAAGTGVYLGGSVSVSQAGMQANGLTGSSTAQVQSGGSLTVLVYDDYAYQPSQTGGTSVQAVARVMTVESGTVSGTQARIVFADASGRVEMVGQISGGRFTGAFHYRNANMVQPGTIGDFVIPTCTLFRCQ